MGSNVRNLRAICLLFLLGPGAAAAADINVVGLTAGKAVVSIDGGKPRTLTVGQVTPEGVKLIAATSESAVFEVDGARQTLAVYRRVLEHDTGNQRALVALQTLAPVDEVEAPAPPAPKPAATPAGRDVTAEKLYATAMSSFRAEEHGQAVLEFTELIEKFPKHSLAASAQYWIGEAYYRQRDFNQAVTEFQRVPDLYPQSPPVAEALLKLGMCYRALHDLPRARETWEQVVKSHPRTEAATQARSLLASLGGGRAPR